MILCGPAEEDNFSFEDLVEAEFDVVQRMAEHYRKPGPAASKPRLYGLSTQVLKSLFQWASITTISRSYRKTPVSVYVKNTV